MPFGAREIRDREQPRSKNKCMLREHYKYSTIQICPMLLVVKKHKQWNPDFSHPRFLNLPKT